MTFVNLIKHGVHTQELVSSTHVDSDFVKWLIGALGKKCSLCYVAYVYLSEMYI